MPITRSLKWPHAADLPPLQPELPRRNQRALLLLVVPLSPPVDKDAAHLKQRRRILEHNRRRRERAGKHRIIGTEAAGPILGSALDDTYILDTSGRSNPA